jgi:hypothetical protein
MNKKLILTFVWVFALNIKTMEKKPQPLTGLGQKIQQHEEYVKAICHLYKINFKDVTIKEPQACPLIEKMVLQKSIIEEYDKIKVNNEKIKQQQQQQINILNHQVQQSKQDQATIQQQQQINILKDQLQQSEQDKNKIFQQQQEINTLNNKLQQLGNSYSNLKKEINNTLKILQFNDFEQDSDIIRCLNATLQLFLNINKEIQSRLPLTNPIYYINQENTTREALSNHFKEFNILEQSKNHYENEIAKLKKQIQEDGNTISKMNVEIDNSKKEIQKLTAELNQIKLGKNSMNNNQNFQMNNNNNNIMFQQEKQKPYQNNNFLFEEYIIKKQDNPLDFEVNINKITQELGDDKKKFLCEIVNYFVSKNLNFDLSQFLNKNSIKSSFTNILLNNKDRIKEECKKLIKPTNKNDSLNPLNLTQYPNGVFFKKLHDSIKTRFNKK